MSTLPADTAAPPAASEEVIASALVSGWGGGELCPVKRWPAAQPQELVAALRRSGPPRPGATFGAIARGSGRAYGDAAQRREGLVIDTRHWRGLEFDPASGLLTAQAGVTLGQILAATVADGWLLPVVPGTQHVSVGGAIASDIHGKNHATAGAFAAHVSCLGLVTADGSEHELHPGSELFDATAGGMGLTGVIAWARLRMRRVGSSLLAVDTDRAPDLDAALSALSVPGGEHRVAWLDLLHGTEPRGIVTRARHIEDGPREPRHVASLPRLTVPAWTPGGLLRPCAIRAFNELRYRRAPRRERDRPEPFGAHMFPLDGLAAWPRLYGPRGFLQYQLVVPPGAERVLRQVLDVLARAHVPCYLAVLKDFGPGGSGHLSFPIEGWTLALDLPRSAAGLGAALDRCDELVAAAGGRVYLSKDARMRPETVAAMYPRLEEWRAVRDAVDPERLWRSDLATRTGLA